MANISNSDDVIDSRDVIARIEELEESRKPFVAGWNMPGYTPDSEPVRFCTFEEAAEFIADEMERDAEMNEAPVSINDDPNPADCDRVESEASELRAAAARVRSATDTEYGETVGRFHWFISHDAGENAFDSPEDHAEYLALKALADEASGYAADWTHGETLIRDSYFKEYAQELAEDCGMVNANATWPNSCIDWNQAARELQMDYTTVDFDGVTYWIR